MLFTVSILSVPNEPVLFSLHRQSLDSDPALLDFPFWRAQSSVCHNLISSRAVKGRRWPHPFLFPPGATTHCQAHLSFCFSCGFWGIHHPVHVLILFKPANSHLSKGGLSNSLSQVTTSVEKQTGEHHQIKASSHFGPE